MPKLKHGSKALCLWHERGVPHHYQGSRWFLAGCQMCERKATADPSLRSAPAIERLTEQTRKARPWVDWTKRRRMERARKAKLLSMYYERIAT